jgi:hypothetical protein
VKTTRGKALRHGIIDYWDDQARLLGCRHHGEFIVLWGKGEATMPEFRAQIQNILNALHRTCLGNGQTHAEVRLVSGRSRSIMDAGVWKVNPGDPWSLVVDNYTWYWTTSIDASHRDTVFEREWMRLYKKASLAFFTRGLYLPPPKPEAKPKPSKNEVRERKIEALETRRANWATKQERARKWIIKIDRSLRGLRRHQ